METCTTEVGLLRKKPCGEAAVAKCANCERALCSRHAIAQVSAGAKRTGKFMCAECDAAERQYQKKLSEQATKTLMGGGVAAAKKPPAAPQTPPAKKPAAAPQAPGAKKNPIDDSGVIEFTPSKKPDDKK